MKDVCQCKKMFWSDESRLLVPDRIRFIYVDVSTHAHEREILAIFHLEKQLYKAKDRHIPCNIRRKSRHYI